MKLPPFLCTLLALFLLLNLPSEAFAQDPAAQFRLEVTRDDATVGGFVEIQVRIKQTNVTPSTLGAFTADINYDPNVLTFVEAISSGLFNQGYDLVFSDLSDGGGSFVRVAATGSSVGGGFGQSPGVDVATAYGIDYGTIQFSINQVIASTLDVRTNTAASSFFVNQSNIPAGAVVDVDVTEFDDATIGPPLPVELASFTAVTDGDAVELNWATASETNNAGFEVQQFQEDDWSPLAFVEGQGTTTESHSYAYRAAGLAPGQHRFRLKQLDFDGGITFSPAVEAFVALPTAHALSEAFPNPFNPTTQFTLTIQREQQVHLAVYDLLGREVALLHDGPLTANTPHHFTVEAPSLPSGLYLYRATGEAFSAAKTITLLK